MGDDRTYAVLGAGGPLGLQCVSRLLELDCRVIAVVRNPDKYADVLPKDDRVSVVRGDVTNKESLEKALSGARGVIFAAAGQSYFGARGVDNLGVENVAVVAKKLKIEPVVLVSSGLVTDKHRFHPIRMMLNSIRWGLMDHKWRGEERLRKSGVIYAIVRPKRLNDNNGKLCKLVVEQGDTGTNGNISRYYVAAVCCAALINPKSRNKTFEIMSEDGEDLPELGYQLETLFDNLKTGICS